MSTLAIVEGIVTPIGILNQVLILPLFKDEVVVKDTDGAVSETIPLSNSAFGTFSVTSLFKGASVGAGTWNLAIDYSLDGVTWISYNTGTYEPTAVPEDNDFKSGLYRFKVSYSGGAVASAAFSYTLCMPVLPM